MRRLLLAVTMLAAPLLTGCAHNDTPQPLVDNATLAVQNMLTTEPGGRDAISVLRRARAVVICPNIFRGALVFGGEGGECLMVARAAGGSWSNPAFYSLGSGSFGAQIGVQNAQVLMLIRTTDGLNALLNSQFKFGADAGITAANFGGNAGGALSTALDADIIIFSKTEGLYGGISLNGSILSSDSGKDQAYYGNAVDARQIVVNMQGANPGANPLRAMLTRYGG